MREVAGFALSQLLLAGGGLVVLGALGLLRGRGARGLLSAAGPAYLAGIAVVIPALILLLVIGVPVTLLTFALVGVGLPLALHLAAGRARRGEPAAVAKPGVPMGWVERAVIAAIGLWVLYGAFTLPGSPVVVDNVGIWAPKALALTFYDHLQPDVFRGVYVKNDYPVLQPLLEAVTYRAMGGPQVDFVNAQLWLVFGAFAWTVGWLLAPRARPLTWLPIVALIAVVPGAYNLVQLGYADVTVAVFLGAGAVSMGLWVDGCRPGYLVLAALLLGAAANTKNEGLVGAAIVVVAALAVTLRDSGRPPLRSIAGGLAPFVLSVLPWRAYIAWHDIPSDDLPPLSRALSPGYLADRTGRAGDAVEAIVDQLADQTVWAWLPPALLGLALVAVVAGAARRLAAYYLLAAVGFVAALVLVYWTSSLDIGFHLSTSVGRTVTGVVFVMGVGAAHLCAALLAEPDE